MISPDDPTDDFNTVSPVINAMINLVVEHAIYIGIPKTTVLTHISNLWDYVEKISENSTNE